MDLSGREGKGRLADPPLNLFLDPALQRLHAFPGFGRDLKVGLREAPAVSRRQQIHLVPEFEDGQGDVRQVRHDLRLGRVQDQKPEIYLFCGLPGPLHAQEFHLVLGFSEPGGVIKDDGNPFDHGLFGDDIPCGSRDFGDDGPVFADQAIEEGGLPGVWRAKDGDSVPSEIEMAPLPGLDQGFQFLHKLLESLSDPGGIQGRDILFKVNPCFDLHDEGHQVLAELTDLMGDLALEAPEGMADRGLGPGLHQVKDRLGLHEVHLSI